MNSNFTRSILMTFLLLQIAVFQSCQSSNSKPRAIAEASAETTSNADQTEIKPEAKTDVKADVKTEEKEKPKPEELTPEQREELKKQIMATEYYQSIIQEKQRQSEQDMPFRGFAIDKRLETIALGSNLNQNQPMPIWKTIEKSNPDLFLFVGNTIFSQKNTIKNILSSLYRKLITNREYRSYREKIPFMSIWSDQELPEGLDAKEKESARKDFTKKWPYIANLISKNQNGLYHSKLFGDKKNKHTTQIIMLDTRWDKNSQQVLSQEQWTWLESELKRSASLRILVSPMALEATQTESITWSNFQNQKEKLLGLIKKSKVKNLIVTTATQGFSSVKKDDFPLIQVGRLNKLTEGKEDDPVAASFAVIKTNWDTKTSSLEIHDLQDQVKDKVEFKFH